MLTNHDEQQWNRPSREIKRSELSCVHCTRVGGLVGGLGEIYGVGMGMEKDLRTVKHGVNQRKNGM